MYSKTLEINKQSIIVYLDNIHLNFDFVTFGHFVYLIKLSFSKYIVSKKEYFHLKHEFVSEQKSH